MLKKLIKFIENNHAETNIDAYLDAKYVQLSNKQLKKIAEAIDKGEIQDIAATNCSADNFIFHFGSTIILLKKHHTDNHMAYIAELAWETDFISIRSVRDKVRGFYFINFEFDDDYQVKLKPTIKIIKDQIDNTEKNQEIIENVMPVLKGFMQAISA